MEGMGLHPGRVPYRVGVSYPRHALEVMDAAGNTYRLAIKALSTLTRDCDCYSSSIQNVRSGRNYM